MSSNSGYSGNIFDAFRDNRGPILYSDNNRIPAVEDVQNIVICISFTTLFIAFLIIFPGIRKERLATFVSVTISLFLGAVILLANFGTSWHVANAKITSPYRAFSKEKITADLGVKVGLLSVNITLKANSNTPFHNKYDDINFNERLYWIGPKEMKQEYHRALAKGLPYPILTIAEYLSQDEEGFCWGRRYRQAGYYASLLLWTSFATWILMNILFCAVPRYGLYMMQITGIIMLIAVGLYAILLPKYGLVIHFEGGIISFQFGNSFYLTLLAGIIAVLTGSIITIIDTLYPNKFSTILEIDYDTPYRYFVGNDAHLFGHLAEESCPHSHVSATSSNATETTVRSGRKSTLRKLKSDASTSTVMSIPIKKERNDSEDTSFSLNDEKLDLSDSKNRLKGQNSNPSIRFQFDQSTNTSGAINPNSGRKVNHQNNNNHLGVINAAFDGDQDKISDNSSDTGSELGSGTTIIDGKRAISLHNFGKVRHHHNHDHIARSARDLPLPPPPPPPPLPLPPSPNVTAPMPPPSTPSMTSSSNQDKEQANSSDSATTSTNRSPEMESPT